MLQYGLDLVTFFLVIKCIRTTPRLMQQNDSLINIVANMRFGPQFATTYAYDGVTQGYKYRSKTIFTSSGVAKYAVINHLEISFC